MQAPADPPEMAAEGVDLHSHLLGDLPEWERRVIDQVGPQHRILIRRDRERSRSPSARPAWVRLSIRAGGLPGENAAATTAASSALRRPRRWGRAGPGPAAHRRGTTAAGTLAAPHDRHHPGRPGGTLGKLAASASSRTTVGTDGVTAQCPTSATISRRNRRSRRSAWARASRCIASGEHTRTSTVS